MNSGPIAAAPVDAREFPLFPDLEYHDRLERQNRVLRWMVATIAAVIMIQALAVFKLAKSSGERIVEVIRINDVGKADAIAYQNADYKPQAPKSATSSPYRCATAMPACAPRSGRISQRTITLSSHILLLR